ncbi:MAG: hypothetical protein N3F03_07410 [Ignavibacteria bacterium]|nr:hypothetical protein [Ignavibacteria bacterium]
MRIDDFESFTEEIKKEKSKIIREIILPEDFWTSTLTLVNVLNKNNGASLTSDVKTENVKPILASKNEKEIPFFMRPRSDWDISKGDYIVEEEKSYRRKIITSRDLKSLKSGLWYILLTILISYYFLTIISKATE